MFPGFLRFSHNRSLISLYRPWNRLIHTQSKTDRRIFMTSKFGPPINRSMTELDRSFFNKQVPLLVAYFPNPKFLGDFVKACKPDILYLPSIKHIVPVDDSKGVLLRADIDDINNYHQQLTGVTKSKIEEYGIEIRPYTMNLDYDFWKSDDILRAVLPENLLDEVPTGFAQAGHVAHINLRDEFKPYGPLIGQVILDKNPKIETVVDKLQTIDTKFRTFQMKVLAGRDDLNVIQSESGCKFKFDFSKVYWNSRLSTEHERLIDQFESQEVVGDVFAGVGPFAIPAAKKNVLVLANDLNPQSYKYLNENIQLNHVENFIKSYNLDGREFIKNSPQLLYDWYNQSPTVEIKKLKKKRKFDGNGNSSSNYDITSINVPKFYSNYVMNLPDSALTFLDAFIGLYSNPTIKSFVKSDPNFKLPIINVHCFEKYSPQEDPEPSQSEIESRIHKRIVGLIQHDLEMEDCKFHLVRRVAPTKPMFCVSFQLPEEVAFREPNL
jgi:tRNA (guanine37-N1)-methyltransferase